MSAKLFTMRRAAGIGAAGFWLLGVIGAHVIDSAWAESDASGAVVSIAASSAVPVKYAVDEKNGTFSWLSGAFQAANPADPVESAYRFLESHQKAFQVQSPRREFSVMMIRKEKQLPGAHVYLAQNINGLPVWGHRLGFHFDPRGVLYAVNGKYCATPSPGQLATKPLITADQAKEYALNHVRNSAGKLPASVAPLTVADKSLPVCLHPQVPQNAALMYYPDSSGALRLSYKVTFSLVSPPGDWIYFIDALSGAVLFRMNNIQTSGAAAGSGLDLFNNVISLNTYLDTDGKYKLINTTKHMYTQHSTHPYTTWQGAIEVRDCGHAESSGSPGLHWTAIRWSMTRMATTCLLTAVRIQRAIISPPSNWQSSLRTLMIFTAVCGAATAWTTSAFP